MVISAINALTLSPALCAVLCKPTTGRSAGPWAGSLRGIDGARDGYVRVVAADCAPGRVCRLIVLLAWRLRHLAGCSASRRPASCPARTRAPSSPRSSCRKAHPSIAPSGRASRWRTILAQMPRCETVVSRHRLQLPRRPRQVEQRLRRSCSLKPFAERTDPSLSVSSADRHGCDASARHSATANVSPSTCRRSSGSAPAAASNTSCRICRAASPADLGATAARPACSRPTRIRLLGPVFTTYSATTPQLYLDIDRDKAADARRIGQRCLQCAAGDAWRLSMSTTSTCSAAPGRSTSRPRRPTAIHVAISIASMCATPRRDGAARVRRRASH